MINETKQDRQAWNFEAYLSEEPATEFDFEGWLAEALFNYWLKSIKESVSARGNNAK